MTKNDPTKNRLDRAIGNQVRKTAGALFMASALLLPAVSLAIPAKTGVFTMIQPDGSTVKITRIGDERNHRTYTEDGYLLTTDPTTGALVYATADADGLIAPSTVTAREIGMRTAGELSFIKTLNRDMIDNAANATERLKRANAASRAANADLPANAGLCDTPLPLKGSPKVIVVLVEYKDVKFTTPDAADYFNAMLNERGFSREGGTGSALDYFIDQSNGQFSPVFDCYGPVTLPNNRAYYGANSALGDDQRPHMMAVHALDALDEEVDLSPYDNDGDGTIDNVYIFYAGQGEATYGPESSVWPHSSDVTKLDSRKHFYDGKLLDHYACSNELYPVDGSSTEFKVDGIGTFVHEFSHVMGLPDLYVTDYNSAPFTPGSYDVLDYGPYNNDSRTPPNYSAHERLAVGWIEPPTLRGSGEYTLEPIADTQQAYFIPTEKENEYFIIENRRQEGWDAYIPGHGMAVWHVDFVKSIWDSNIVNNSATHQYVDLVEADNSRTTVSRDGDLFPGTRGMTEFGFETRPQLKSWGGKTLGLEFTNIREEGRDIKFTLTDSTSSVNDINTASGTVSASGEAIHSTLGEDCEVYDTMGRHCGTLRAGGSLATGSGLFIVTTPEGAVKVLVK